MPFQTTDEIEQHFADAINRAGSNDAAVVELRREKQAVLADFREDKIRQRERGVWVREAFQKYPLAKSFPQLIEGETEEAVEQSAKTVHDRLEGVFTEHQRNQEMRRLYEASLKLGIDSEQILRSQQGWKPPTEAPNESAVRNP